MSYIKQFNWYTKQVLVCAPPTKQSNLNKLYFHKYIYLINFPLLFTSFYTVTFIAVLTKDLKRHSPKSGHEIRVSGPWDLRLGSGTLWPWDLGRWDSGTGTLGNGILTPGTLVMGPWDPVTSNWPPSQIVLTYLWSIFWNGMAWVSKT